MIKKYFLVILSGIIILTVVIFVNFNSNKNALSFPNDDDGNVLKELYKHGVDFSKPQIVDFCISVPDEVNGEKILKLVQEQGFKNCNVDKDEKYNTWTCYCQKKMLLDYNVIISIQKSLDKISKPYGGYSDGWGVMVEPKK
jgi:hypothetical protein